MTLEAAKKDLTIWSIALLGLTGAAIGAAIIVRNKAVYLLEKFPEFFEE